MYSLRTPSAAAISDFRRSQSDLPTFPVAQEVPDPPPPGFRPNRGTGPVGTGGADFRAAIEAVRNWEMFPEDFTGLQRPADNWVQVDAGSEPVHVGQIAAVIARCFGIWTVNCCRVLAINETAPL